MTRPDSATDSSRAVDEDGERPSLGFYIPNLTVGGAEQVTVNIVNGLSRRGYDVELVLSHPYGKLHSEIDEDVPVVALGDSRVPVAGITAHVPKLVSYLEESEPDALLSQVTHANTVCLAASLVADTRTKLIPTEHNAFDVEPATTLKSKLLRKLAVRLLPSADRVIAVSQGVSDSLVEQMSLREDDVTVLHNPIEIERVRERAHQSVDHEWIEDDDLDVVLFVGRLDSQKDLQTWLRAFDRVHESRPDTRAVVAGQGPLREELHDSAEQMGISDAVSVPGYVDNPYRYMHRASVFLLTSRFEGLPTVLIEAMACGCPVVSTDCPSGPREILADGQYGRLTPVGDVSEIATAVEKTLDDETDTSALKRRANDFSPAEVLDDYERFIQTSLR
ncbi:glycosyltransferase [Haloarcula salina]|uniref:Glycosyltransferase n=1 Tax=Haloarcula salina TaxID=1429914 RepID=A0AA41G317_9EURY|nr:glycosyltransferase [Haloarcula salina]MBV0902719.1 glycosyltransferase [Haloarcula salina]